MVNLSQLRKEIGELKAITNKEEKSTGFDILDKYINKEIGYSEAMELLEEKEYSFGDMVKLIIESSVMTDEEKKRELLK